MCLFWWSRGGGACSYVLRAVAVRPLTTRPRKDGALFPQDQSLMANRSNYVAAI
ncbi:unnamed protein product [Ectocarpus sp. 13 AM-2016]